MSFWTDFKKFKLEGFTDDIYDLFCKRVYDLAGVLNKHVKVFLNEEEIEIQKFEDYVDYYIKSDNDILKLNFKCSRWEVVVTASEGDF